MARIHHGGGLTAAAARYGGRVEDWLDLSTGINPNPAPLPEISLAVWNRLPDRGLVEEASKAAFAWYLGAPCENGAETGLPLPVPGTQAFIQVLPRLVPRVRPVAILSPTYGEYRHCFERSGFVVEQITTLEDLRPEHGTLVVVNPNNPDGRVLEPARLAEIALRMRATGGHLHVDEAFGDSRPELSVAALANAEPGMTVSRSFGKFFGLAGLRLGFVFGSAPLLERIDTALGPWAVSGPALHIANRLMKQGRAGIAGALAERRAGLQAVLDRAELTVVGGTDLFALVAHENAQGLFEHLATSHILVRKFDHATHWLRIGLAANRAGDERLAAALASF